MLINKKIRFSLDNPKNQLIITITVSSISIFAIIIFGKLFIHPFMTGWYYLDDAAYFVMGEFFFSGGMAPYKYRILTPFLVYLLPFDTLVDFMVINISALFATSILFFNYLKKIGFTFGVSLMGTLIYILNPINITYLWAICFIDLLFIFFFLLSFYAVLIENRNLFIISTSLGILDKEVMLLCLLFFFFYEIKKKNFLISLKTSILVSLPSISLFLLIRIILTDYTLDFWYYSLDFVIFVININYKLFNKSLFYFPYSFYITFGMMWILSVINLYRLDNVFLKRCLPLVPFIFAQAVLGTAFSRLWFILFPIIIPIGLYIFKKEISKRIIIILFLLAILLLILHIIIIYHLIEALGTMLSVYNRLSTESYSYMIFLEVLSEIFVIFILFYKLITISKKKNEELII